jgi:hypothetical protein
LKLRRSARSLKETKFLRPNDGSARKWRDTPTTARDEKGKIPRLIEITSAIDFKVGRMVTLDDDDDDKTAEMTPASKDESAGIALGITFSPLEIVDTHLEAARNLSFELLSPVAKKKDDIIQE